MTTAKRPRSAGKSAEPAKTTMADYAMSFDDLGLWLAERAKSKTLRHPQATSLSMLDGAIAAIVAGPVSMPQEEWVCPLLGVDPDDFNHDTETFSAIAATLMRHNAISNTLPTKPKNFEPLFLRRPNGELDPRPWCMGFYAVMKLRLLTWSRLMSPDTIEHALLLPILTHCVDTDGRPVLGATRHGLAYPPLVQDAPRDIPTVVEALRQYWMPTRFAPGK
jgi:yecA family protein